jgi:penicillin-binding protein 2
VRDASGQVRAIAPIADPSIEGVSDADWEIVRNGMIGSATYGTAAAVSHGASYTIAGKTGTAQVFTVSRSERLTQQVSERLKDHAWFIAFAPVEAPRIAVAVLVENGGFGSSAAAPIARKVMDAYLLRQTTANPNDTATPEAQAED